MSAALSGARVLLRSEQSDGQVSVIETAPGPGVGPPLHVHDFDEAFYVLEGELTFRLRDEVFRAGPGELAFAPRGVPHTFANLSDAPARQLIVCTPAGFERYFARMSAERQGKEPPEWALRPIPEVTTVGPPIDPQAVGHGHTREGRRSDQQQTRSSAAGRKPRRHAKTPRCLPAAWSPPPSWEGRH